MATKSLYLLLLLVSICKLGFTQQWTLAGPDDANQPFVFPSSQTLKSDHNGGLYLAYTRLVRGKYLPSLKHWADGEWQQTGAQDFLNDNVSNLDMAVTQTGTPYVIFKNADSSGKSYVMSYNGTSWVQLGDAIFPEEVQNNVIALSANDSIYVAFINEADTNKVTVKKWNGTEWQVVGSPSFSHTGVWDLKLRLNSNGQPYVLVQYYNGTTYANEVMTLNGSQWVSLGIAGTTNPLTTNSIDLTISGSDTVFVAYSDDSQDGKATVRKLNGSGWVMVGQAGISPSAAGEMQLHIDPQNGPYLFYQSTLEYNSYDTYYAMAENFDGNTWNFLGADTLITPGISQYPSLAIDTAHNLYFVCTDGLYNQKATMRKFNGTNWEIADAGAGFTNSPALMTLAASAPGGQKAFIMTSTVTSSDIYNPSVSLSPKVYRYADSSWTLIGSPVSNGSSIWPTSIAVSPDGHPWVTSSVFDTAVGLIHYSIWRYADTGWIEVNMPNGQQTASVSQIAFDKEGNAYVLTGGYQTQMLIRKYSTGGVWSVLNGSPLPSSSTVDYTVLKISPADTPYVLLGIHGSSATGNQYAFDIKKYDGTTWVSAINYSINSGMGTPAGSTPGLDIDSTGQLYITYINDNQENILVRKYNRTTSSFEDVGAPGTYIHRGIQPSIQFSPNGQLYLCYIDRTAAFYGSLTVERLTDANTWETVGTPSFSTTAINQRPGMAFLNDELLTTFTDGSAYAYRFKCGQQPLVGQQPDTFIACKNGNALFTISNLNSTNYSWQTNRGQGWENIVDNATYSGASTDSLSIVGVTDDNDGNLFRCIITDSCGLTNISQETILSVAPDVPPTLNITANPGGTISSGEAVTFTAHVQNGGINPQIKWFVNSGLIAGATGTNYTTNTLSDGDTVTAKITRADDCVANNEATASITVQVTTGIHSVSSNSQLKVYPQPANGYVTIAGRASLPYGSYSLQIISMTGQKMLEKQVKISSDNWHYRLTLPASIPNGLYILKLANSNVIYNTKISIIN